MTLLRANGRLGLVLGRMAKGDFAADWRRWTPGERIAVVVLALSLPVILAVVVVLAR